jgi:hypothetical protein
MKITKIHRGISFQEGECMRDYIELNIRLRIATIYDFEKNFFKLMNNSVFGQIMRMLRSTLMSGSLLTEEA